MWVYVFIEAIDAYFTVVPFCFTVVPFDEECSGKVKSCMVSGFVSGSLACSAWLAVKSPGRPWTPSAFLDIEQRLHKVKGYRHLTRWREVLRRELNIEKVTTRNVV
jgi:hypothetical protein